MFGLTGDDIENFWIKDHVTVIILDATDYAEPCDIGVEEIHYRICLDGNEDNAFDEEECGSWVIVQGDHTEFTIDEDCLHKVEWFAVDMLGNTEADTPSTTGLIQRLLQPTKTIGDPKWWDENLGLWWVTSSTEFTLTAVDNQAPCDVGVDEVWYKIDNDKNCDGDFNDLHEQGSWYSTTDSTYTFTLTGECWHQISWYAVDKLGNTEETHVQFHKVDNTPPHVIILKPVDGWYSDGEDIPIVAIAEDMNNDESTCEGECHDECGLGDECA